MAQIYKCGTRDCPQPLFSDAALAIGVFDGLHLGHRSLIAGLGGEGGRRGVLTFSPDPEEVVMPGRMRKIMSDDQRIKALADTDVDFVAVLDFDEEFSRLSPAAFLEQLFGRDVPGSIHVGEGFRFGHKAAGTVDDMRAWGQVHGCKVEEVPLLEVDGVRVSSTRIRELLSASDIFQANRLLGHRYRVAGIVEHGRKEGADMGFATANVDIPEKLRVLGDGVYAAYAHFDGVVHKAAVSMGVSPTFEDAHANCEAHIIDFDGDLYEKTIDLEFVEHLRPMRKFDDVDELIRTVMGNIEWVRNNL